MSIPGPDQSVAVNRTLTYVFDANGVDETAPLIYSWEIRGCLGRGRLPVRRQVDQLAHTDRELRIAST